MENYEGTEKTLELEFAIPVSDKRGLRSWSKEIWDGLLAKAQCTILHEMPSPEVDSYILSESSLFVYRNQLVVKTCGRTTLLEFAPACVKQAKLQDWKVTFFLYRRKNLLWPEEQRWPHGNPEHEQTFLDKYFPSGEGYVMGPTKGDHWYLYIADMIPAAAVSEPEQTLELMMHDCPPSVMEAFWNEGRLRTAEGVTRATGIDSLIEGSEIQSCLFEPCGYSMNGLKGKYYWTIHITPEDHCSYVSFETNLPFGNYSDLVKKVLDLFQPKLSIVALVADLDSAVKNETPIQPLALNNYKLRNKIHTTFEGDYHCWMYKLGRELKGVEGRRHASTKNEDAARASSMPKQAVSQAETCRTEVPPSDDGHSPTSSCSSSRLRDVASGLRADEGGPS